MASDKHELCKKHCAIFDAAISALVDSKQYGKLRSYLTLMSVSVHVVCTTDTQDFLRCIITTLDHDDIMVSLDTAQRCIRGVVDNIQIVCIHVNDECISSLNDLVQDLWQYMDRCDLLESFEYINDGRETLIEVIP